MLRALQERKIRPVGSAKEIQVDIRLVSATNEDLQKAIEIGSFREDLYHRINEFTLKMPTLKERTQDIMLFANFFLEQANKELGKEVQGFAPHDVELLLNYNWPGNLREMKNVIKSATLLSTSQEIEAIALGITVNETNANKLSDLSLKNETTEKEQILEALRQADNNKSKAARLLNIDRKTLYNKLKLYNLE